MKDLINSDIERKNILNNNYAIEELHKKINFTGILFENRYRYTKKQVAEYYQVEERTIDRILDNHREELDNNGHELFKHTKLKRFKETVNNYVNDINVVNINKIVENEIVNEKSPIINVFDFKAFLNVGMLLSDSEKAKEVRSLILDIVIDLLNKKIGGNTKYINQREESFITSAISEINYRKEFTNALNNYVEENKYKYPNITNRIYISVFNEDAKEYKKILSLNKNDKVRETLYSEVLDLIASYENGFAECLQKQSNQQNRKLRLEEVYLLFEEFEKNTEKIYEPLKNKARISMASRDMTFRDALHLKLKEYIKPISSEEFDKFIGEKSKSLEDRIEENKDIFLRLKDR